MEQKYLKFSMEIGESPKDQVKKNDGKLHDSKHCYSMLHPSPFYYCSCDH